MAVLVCMITSCTGRHASHNVVARNEAFTLTGDSLVQGDIIATAPTGQFIESTLTRERLDSIVQAFATATGDDRQPPRIVGGRPWHAAQHNEQFPQYHSRQRLIDALSRMSIDHIADDTKGSTFSAHGDTLTLCLAIYMSLAHIDPQRSMATLKAMVAAGRVIPFAGRHMSAARQAWAVAAWEVYTATADKHWLAFAHSVIDATLADDILLLKDHTTQLMHGFSGYTPDAFYPPWMQQVDVIETMPLLSNLLTWKAMCVLNDIDDEMQSTHNHGYDPSRLKSAINQRLWSEVRGRYSAYLYGYIYNLRAPIADNMAQALAVLWGIADDDRAATLIKQTPVTLFGVPVVFPLNTPVEPYFSHPCWPAVQALWVMAAATVGNDDMVRAGIAALLRAQALFMSRHIAPQGKPRNHLLTAAANQAIMLRVIMGINFMPDGIEINPHIPISLTGRRQLLGLRHAQALIDVTINGNGTDVKAIAIDGNDAEGNFVAALPAGRHTVNVTVEPGNTSRGLTVVTGAVAPPPPPEVMWTPDSGFVTDYVTGGRYMTVVNGRFSYSLSDIAFAIPEADSNTTELSVAMANKYGFSFMAQPHIIPANDTRILPLTGNDSIRLDFDVNRAGNYLLQVEYANQGTGDALMITVNTHHQGTLFMPAMAGIARDGEATAAKLRSNFVTVQLLRGRNSITLTRHARIPASATPQALILMPK